MTIAENLSQILSAKRDIKSALEAKGVDMTDVAFGGYASKIGEISGVPDVDFVLTGNATEVPASKFYCAASEKMLTRVDLPECTMVGASAFRYQTALSYANLPKCTETKTNAFVYCYNLADINIENCQTLGDYTFTYCSSLSRAILENCQTVGGSAFKGCVALSEVSLPACTSIGSSAFLNCKALSKVDLPLVESLPNNIFAGCTALSEVSLPVCKYVYAYAFNGCTNANFNLELSACESIIGTTVFRSCKGVVSLPNCSSFHGGAFDGCAAKSVYAPLLNTNLTGENSIVSIYAGYTKITSGMFSPSTLDTTSLFTAIKRVNFPSCTSVGLAAFSNCANLIQAKLNACTHLGSAAFYGCSVLSSVALNNCKFVSNDAFLNCHSLSTISLPNCTIIYSGAFRLCRTLLSLYLTGSTLVTLTNRSIFYSTPISTYTLYTSGANGSIYVPASLYNSYKTATNWVLYSARFVSI